MEVPMPILLFLAALVAGPAETPAPAAETIVANPEALARLRRNTGLTLQWISWDYRGRLRVTDRGGTVHLSGNQTGSGRLEIDGDVVSINADGFAFRGRIIITDTPDSGRSCVRDGEFHFRITGQRRYWRLQEMETCDGLTDYVDIYF
jgi:hypothetical protein